MALGRKARIILVGAAVAILIIVGAGVASHVVRVVRVMKHADMAYRSVIHVTDFVEIFVREQRKWPTSWKELESVSRTDGTEILPGGWDEVREYVEVDFGRTLHQVASDDVDDFDAIRPIGPVWGNYRAFFVPLLETVRKVEEPAKQEGTVPNGTVESAMRSQAP